MNKTKNRYLFGIKEIWRKIFGKLRFGCCFRIGRLLSFSLVRISLPFSFVFSRKWWVVWWHYVAGKFELVMLLWSSDENRKDYWCVTVVEFAVIDLCDFLKKYSKCFSYVHDMFIWESGKIWCLIWKVRREEKEMCLCDVIGDCQIFWLWRVNSAQLVTVYL